MFASIKDTFVFVASFIAVIVSALITGAILCIPISHIVINSEIKQFQATKEFIKQMRVDGSLEERMATILDITGQNRWLTSVQYYNGTILDFWVPDKVDEIGLIGIYSE